MSPDDEERVHIRHAVAQDVPAIAEIERNVFPDPWSATSFAHIIRESHSRMAVAVKGKTLIGYSVAMFVADEAELANLAVRPENRGAGVGGALLDDVFAEAWRRGAQNIYLEVRALNHTAQGLYRRAGFKEVGRRARYYSRPVDDAIMMVKERPV